MSNTDFTLPVQYIRQIAEQMTRMGVELPASFDSRWLTAPPHGQSLQSMSMAHFERLVLDAIARTDEPAFGLLVGERLLVNSHGMLGYAAMNSGTLREAIELLVSYFQVRTTLLRARQERVNGQLLLILDETLPLGAIRRPVLEAVVLTVKKLFDYVTMGACQVRSIAFPFSEPTHGKLARELFGVEVRYDQQWAGLVFPEATLDTPLHMANPTTFNEAKLLCQQELDKVKQLQSWGAKVRGTLLDHQSGFPSLNVTARLFHVTPHTLHRRLVAEGTSFRDILEDVRHTLAVIHLQNGQLSIQEIAFNLGYTDLANFRRAFKRWESVSPSAFRKKPPSHTRLSG